ncbi:myb dna-binding domain protein [Paraphaeosphaeria minitans]|uniref:Myb dna-binding domain protein n=1 Tax=Paraphaeosphaeria minitans TaxID=565426 RepID=A0A9P6GBB2_9PLEO|nr:myb dna-binding domain protein [Paraphaeosphaeria minitans]
MQGGPVLPAISELHRQQEPGPPPPPQFRPLYSGAAVTVTSTGSNGSPPSHILKRATSQTPLPEESPAKKQSKWTPEEDNLTIELRGQGMKWDDIAKRLPGRSSISCRLRYQNYLEKRAVWDEEKKNKLARLYARLCRRFKDQMWQKVATEMGIPWRSAESMHWQLGEQEMSARANAPVFQLHPSATNTGLKSPPTASVPVSIPGQPPPLPVIQNQMPPSHGFTATNAPQPMQYAQPPPPPPPQQQQQYQQPPPLPQAATHPSHRRSDSNSSQGFSRRRARNSVPPQLGPTMPPFNPQSETDLVSGARTAPVPDTTAREDEGPLGERFGKRKRDDECAQGLRADGDACSQGGRSPDRVSLRSGTGSVKSLKRSVGDADDAEQARLGPPAPAA